MNTKIAFIFIFVSALVVLADAEGSCSKKAKEEAQVEEKEPSCKEKAQAVKDREAKIGREELYKLCNKERVQAYKSSQASVETCVAEYTEKAQSSPRHLNSNDCIAKCVLEAEISLDESGLVTGDKLTAAISQRFEDYGYRQTASKKLNTCRKDLGTPELLASTDVSCGGYEKLALCMQESLKDMCEEYNPANKSKDEL